MVEVGKGTLLTSEYLDKKFGIKKHNSWHTDVDPYMDFDPIRGYVRKKNAPELKRYYTYGMPCNFILEEHSGGFSLDTEYSTETGSDQIGHFNITTVEEFEEVYAFLKKFDK